MKATIYFDKSETGAKSFEFDSFSERVSDNTLNVSIRYELAAKNGVPDFKEFSNLEFTKMEIQDRNGNRVPYFGTYGRIDDITVNFYESDNIYNVSVTIM